MPSVRVVLAPDCFGETLSAPEAAQAMADGWSRARPADELVLLPMSDGGPGFLDALPGRRISVLVQDPLGRPTVATYLLDGTTAYVESAQACGLHLLDPGERDPAVTTTYGVGQLVRAAVEAGATRVVVGLGGSATNDGGAGFLAALEGVPLDVRLVAATDVDNPLLGPHGATAVFGPQKRATDLRSLERALTELADRVERQLSVRVRDVPGAGAAGGLGFALLALGATREPGVDVVASAVGLAAEVARADLVVTGEGAFDVSSLRGKVVSGVARVAREQAVPCLVLAGRVALGHREAATAGVEASYSLVEAVGEERALGAPAEALSLVALRVAEQRSV